MTGDFKVTLKALRVNANLELKGAAEALGVTIQTVRNWENYTTFPNLMQLRRICEVYHCGLDNIFIPDELTESESEDN